MSDFRLSQKSDIKFLKKIWQLSFGDDESFINFFYENRYKEKETALLVNQGEIAAMLTMLPISIITPDQERLKSKMLYAIATHPEFRNRGLATQLIKYTEQYLSGLNNSFSVLVPANQELFGFYRRIGFQDCFYIREIQYKDKIEALSTKDYKQIKLEEISAKDYNQIRYNLLLGKLFIDYDISDIAYQKKISQLNGADIFSINIGDELGCLAIEFINKDKILIKELIISKDIIHLAIKYILQTFNVKECVLRTPVFSEETLEGTIRPFGMIKANQHHTNYEIDSARQGYLGLAFD